MANMPLLFPATIEYDSSENKSGSEASTVPMTVPSGQWSRIDVVNCGIEPGAPEKLSITEPPKLGPRDWPPRKKPPEPDGAKEKPPKPPKPPTPPKPPKTPRPLYPLLVVTKPVIKGGSLTFVIATTTRRLVSVNAGLAGLLISTNNSNC